MRHILPIIACALLILALVCICFNLKLQSNETQEMLNADALVPPLNLSNPRSIIQPGNCSIDSDCQHENLYCLGNTCVLKPDVPLQEQCNEENGCISAIVGLDTLGQVVNTCIPSSSQLFDRNNCNTQNPYTCANGVIKNGRCVPDEGYSVVYYTTYGGREVIPITLESNIASLFLTANPTVLYSSEYQALRAALNNNTNV